MLSLLGQKSSHSEIVSSILDKLDPQDLCALSMVCRSWNSICKKDTRNAKRRETYVSERQSVKENLKKKDKAKESLETSTPKIKLRKSMPLQNRNRCRSPRKASPTSPPVSPSKRVFHSYVKVSHLLDLVSCMRFKVLEEPMLDSNGWFESTENWLKVSKTMRYLDEIVQGASQLLNLTAQTFLPLKRDHRCYLPSSQGSITR